MSARRILTSLMTLVVLAGLHLPASAQTFTGRVDVTIMDSTGAVLPGVTVDLTGPQSQSAVTDASGEAHFLNLTPGTYTVAAKLQGFGDYANNKVAVLAGAAVPLRVTLGVAGMASTVEVTAETPTIDPKKSAISTNITNDELQSIPSSRDPWVVLQTVPGIIVDRVNVGGAESGQQSSFQSRGSAGSENTFNIDGVAITDMSALGSSSTYYDFDMFQEMQVTTGGADVTAATGGASLNFVLKSGSNRPSGSGRYIFTGQDFQSANLPDDLAATLGGASGKGNRMDEFKDYGGEIGGPIWRDRLWAWGAIGKTDVTVLNLQGNPDATFLTNYSFKGTAQATDDLRGNFTYFQGVKEKFGRGTTPLAAPEATHNQGGPTKLYKGEANYVASDSLFLTGRWSHVAGGFTLTPQGGLDVNMIFRDDAGIGRNSYYDYATVRPQYASALEANYFRGRHELKAGFGYRTAEVSSTYTVPGNAIVTFYNGYPNMNASVTAYNQFTGAGTKYTNAFLSDTVSFDRLTLNLGLRWDRQAASVLAYSQKGNALLPSLLPDLTGQAADDAIVWNSLSPRIGASYALTEDRGTILRASYATFAGQMNSGQAGFYSTVGSLRYVYFYNVNDANGNGTVDAAEIAGRTCTNALRAAGDCAYGGFNIANPANVSSPAHVIGDYGTPLTHEVVFGMDHELMPNFGVSANATWRHFNNFNWRPVAGLRGDDYEQRGTFTGTTPEGTVDVPFFGVRADALPGINTGITEYVNRDDYTQRYLGFELSATKRLSNRWMARLGFSTNDHREYFGSDQAYTDPTSTLANPNKDGGQVLRATGGSGKGAIYMVLPKYQLIANGMYQAMWGINLAGNMTMRQGYSMAYNRTSTPTGDPLGNTKTLLLVDDVAQYRLPTVTSLDVRVGKEFGATVGSYRPRFNVDVDFFNVLNSATVLSRRFDQRLTTANQVLEIMNPRIIRFGVRMNF